MPLKKHINNNNNNNNSNNSNSTSTKMTTESVTFKCCLDGFFPSLFFFWMSYGYTTERVASRYYMRGGSVMGRWFIIFLTGFFGICLLSESIRCAIILLDRPLRKMRDFVNENRTAIYRCFVYSVIAISFGALIYTDPKIFATNFGIRKLSMSVFLDMQYMVWSLMAIFFGTSIIKTVFTETRGFFKELLC